MGRVLAENITADRDLPPYNRVTMDGIAIRHSAFLQGVRAFRIMGTVAAGDTPVDFEETDQCVEIMTGAALPESADSVIRYEDIEIKDGIAGVTDIRLKKGQNVHRQGTDKKQGATVIKSPCYIDAAVISMAASVGRSSLLVRKLPRVVIISTGDELVDIDQQPTDWQIRKSNSYAISASLLQHGIHADSLHIADDPAVTQEKITQCMQQYDVIMLSGGISMGKFDYVPQALGELGVTKLFHKVKQRPGKPFWFGNHQASNTLVFAFPGNPVSCFLCLYRYFLPWLKASLSGDTSPNMPVAALDTAVTFEPPLQYFMQVRLYIGDDSRLMAKPMEGNGSGDFSNLLEANAFMELPAEQSTFSMGEQFKVWPFKPIV
jgi:molybdopterin molybdotransferase